jgi:riboflavin kinase/FMN adenylyltransferase
MRILTEGYLNSEKSFAATIGFFDGVHKGHQYLISKLQALAKSMGMESMVISFREHPRLVVQPEAEVLLLTTNEQKCEIIEQLGIDVTVLLNFTREMMNMTAYEFMKYLHDSLHVKVLLIGYDHRFGHNRSEGFEDYVRYGKEIGIQVVRAQEERLSKEQGVSSSVVRQFIQEGNMVEAAHCLGHFYGFTGKVIPGYHNGQKLGFPTANLQPDIPNRLLPPVGVYVVWATLDGHAYKGMLNIGYRHTISFDGHLTLEVHLLNFQGEIYGEFVKIDFVHRLRDEVKFSSPQQLVEQLERDVQSVDIYLR